MLLGGKCNIITDLFHKISVTNVLSLFKNNDNFQFDNILYLFYRSTN